MGVKEMKYEVHIGNQCIACGKDNWIVKRGFKICKCGQKCWLTKLKMKNKDIRYSYKQQEVMPENAIITQDKNDVLVIDTHRIV